MYSRTKDIVNIKFELQHDTILQSFWIGLLTINQLLSNDRQFIRQDLLGNFRTFFSKSS